MISVFTPIFHNPHPGFSRLDGVPEVCKGRWRHIRMTNHVVVFPDQFLIGKPAYIAEIVIAIRYGTFQIRAGDNADI
jgi:hypothetical protein